MKLGPALFAARLTEHMSHLTNLLDVHTKATAPNVSAQGSNSGTVLLQNQDTKLLSNKMIIITFLLSSKMIFVKKWNPYIIVQQEFCSLFFPVKTCKL